MLNQPREFDNTTGMNITGYQGWWSNESGHSSKPELLFELEEEFCEAESKVRIAILIDRVS